MKILVVDDDPYVLALTSSILASGGYEVTEASTGKKALEAVARDRPDMVVLDVLLPDMNGFEVCKQIKSDPLLCSTLVALQSGVSTSSEAQTTGFDIGADGYIVKGIPNNELLARVRSLARIKETEDALKRAHDELDERVKARTTELAAANQRLVASEKALRERLRLETLLAELSARFVALASDQVDHEIEEALGRICESVGCDRSTLWQFSAGDLQAPLLLTHVCGSWEAPAPRGLEGRDLFPWTVQRALAGETVAVSTMAELPPEAASDRDTWRRYGTRSALVIPLSAGGGTMVGVISFALGREERGWPDTLVSYLQLVAQVFANALFRKYVDEAMQESEERLNLAVESAGIGLWSVNLVSRDLWNSESSFRLLGLDPGVDLTEEFFFSLVHPDDRERLRQIMVGSVLSETDVRVDYRVLLPDGTVRWLISRARPHFTSSGEPDRLAGVSMDFTERKQMEVKIREAAEEWQRTF
jgi:PAS domain S-box-containing protein